MTPPNHVVLKVEYAEPTARGNTATNVQKPVKLETGGEIPAPAVRQHGRLPPHRHPHRRVHRAGQGTGRADVHVTRRIPVTIVRPYSTSLN